MAANASGCNGIKTQCCPRHAVPESLTITFTPTGCPPSSGTLVLVADLAGPKWQLPEGGSIALNCKHFPGDTCHDISPAPVLRCSGSGTTGWQLSMGGFNFMSTGGSCAGSVSINFGNVSVSGCDPTTTVGISVSE